MVKEINSRRDVFPTCEMCFIEMATKMIEISKENDVKVAELVERLKKQMESGQYPPVE